MKKFKVFVYRDGGWFRKWREDWDLEADEYSVYKDEATFWKNAEPIINTPGLYPNKCLPPIIVASFKADKYSIMEVK